MIEYKTEAPERAKAPDGTPVYCAYDELVPIKNLKPNPKNPNTHNEQQIKLLASIIQATGWRAPITVSKLSGYIVKGHGRRMAAIHAGLKYVPIEYQNYTNSDEEHADLIADNRIAELSAIDDEKLIKLLEDMAEVPLDLTGYNQDEIVKMLEGSEEPIDETQEQEEAKEQEEQFTKPGDLWLLGRHRLLCGSATNDEDVARLMDGRVAQMVHTDPPYGVSYEDTKGRSLKNDELTDDDLANNLLIPAFKNYVKYTEDTAAYYIWYAFLNRTPFETALTAAGLIPYQQIIWVKNNFVITRTAYHWQHEPCYLAAKAGESAKFHGDRSNTTTWRITQNTAKEATITLSGGVVISDGKNRLFINDKVPKGRKYRSTKVTPDKTVYIQGDSDNSTVWEIAKDTETIHPTQKPVEIPIRAIINSSKEGDIVLDFFGGSGSTMMAAEITGRTCHTMELDPKYCDAIIKRFILTVGAEDIRCQRNGKEYTIGEILAGTA